MTLVAVRGRLRAVGSGYRNAAEPDRPFVDPGDLKLYAISQYGDRCFICGEENVEVLGITHPLTSKCGIHKYRFLRARHWPPGGKVVCLSCTGSMVRRISE